MKELKRGSIGCPECESTLLGWDWSTQANVFVLGCEECSATVRHLTPDEVAQRMNDRLER